MISSQLSGPIHHPGFALGRVTRYSAFASLTKMNYVFLAYILRFQCPMTHTIGLCLECQKNSLIDYLSVGKTAGLIQSVYVSLSISVASESAATDIHHATNLSINLRRSRDGTFVRGGRTYGRRPTGGVPSSIRPSVRLIQFAFFFFFFQYCAGQRFIAALSHNWRSGQEGLVRS